MSWLWSCCGSSRSDATSAPTGRNDGEREPLLISVPPTRTAPVMTTVSAANKNKTDEPITTDESLVVVLLDGDADFFKADYLNNGFHGGRRASIALHERVRAFLHQRNGGAKSAPARPRIVVMSFCNLWGVSSYIAKRPLQAFVQGFNSSPFASSMMDTGPASQSADNAMRNYLEALIASCHLMILGGNHDGGLAVVLHRLESHLLKRVVLLRTTPFVATPLKDMNLDQVVFEDLFDGRDPRPEGQRGEKKPSAAPPPQTTQTTSTTTSTPKKAVKDENARPAETHPTPHPKKVTVATAEEMARTPSSKSQNHAVPGKAPLQSTQTTATPSDAVPATTKKQVKERKSLTDLKASGEADKHVKNLVDALRALNKTGVDKPTLPVIRAAFDCAPWPVIDVVKAAEESGQVRVRYEEGSEGHWIEVIDASASAGPSSSSTAIAPPSKEKDAALRKIPGRFKDLIDALLLLKSKGETAPLRSKVGSMVTTNRGTTFKELVMDAQAFGLVKLAKGKGYGSETISLSDSAVKMTTASSSSPTTTSTTTTGKVVNEKKGDDEGGGGAKPKLPDATEMIEKSVDVRKLVEALAQLREKGQDRPLRSAVGGLLAGKLRETTFKQLASNCAEAGIVELGSDNPNVTGHEWIRLVLDVVQ